MVTPESASQQLGSAQQIVEQRRSQLETAKATVSGVAQRAQSQQAVRNLSRLQRAQLQSKISGAQQQLSQNEEIVASEEQALADANKQLEAGQSESNRQQQAFDIAMKYYRRGESGELQVAGENKLVKDYYYKIKSGREQAIESILTDIKNGGGNPALVEADVRKIITSKDYLTPIEQSVYGKYFAVKGQVQPTTVTSVYSPAQQLAPVYTADYQKYNRNLTPQILLGFSNAIPVVTPTRLVTDSNIQKGVKYAIDKNQEFVEYGFTKLAEAGRKPVTTVTTMPTQMYYPSGTSKGEIVNGKTVFFVPAPAKEPEGFGMPTVTVTRNSYQEAENIGRGAGFIFRSTAYSVPILGQSLLLSEGMGSLEESNQIVVPTETQVLEENRPVTVDREEYTKWLNETPEGQQYRQQVKDYVDSIRRQKQSLQRQGYFALGALALEGTLFAGSKLFKKQVTRLPQKEAVLEKDYTKSPSITRQTDGGFIKDVSVYRVPKTYVKTDTLFKQYLRKVPLVKDLKIVKPTLTQISPTIRYRYWIEGRTTKAKSGLFTDETLHVSRELPAQTKFTNFRGHSDWIISKERQLLVPTKVTDKTVEGLVFSVQSKPVDIVDEVTFKNKLEPYTEFRPVKAEVLRVKSARFGELPSDTIGTKVKTAVVDKEAFIQLIKNDQGQLRVGNINIIDIKNPPETTVTFRKTRLPKLPTPSDSRITNSLQKITELPKTKLTSEQITKSAPALAVTTKASAPTLSITSYSPVANSESSIGALGSANVLKSSTSTLKLSSPQILKTKGAEEEILNNRQNQNTVEIQQLRQGASLDSTLKQATSLKTDTRVKLETPTITVPSNQPNKPSIGKPPGKPYFELPLPVRSGKKKPSVSFGKAYDVFIKRQGKYVKVADDLPLGLAKKKGVTITKNTIASSFRLVRDEKAQASVPDISYKVPEDLFRTYKINKGKQVALPQGDKVYEFIERRSKRLTSSGERSDIKMFRRGNKRRMFF